MGSLRSPCGRGFTPRALHRSAQQATPVQEPVCGSTRLSLDDELLMDILRVAQSGMQP